MELPTVANLMLLSESSAQEGVIEWMTHHRLMGTKFAIACNLTVSN
jgi:hypothetical protein